MITTKAGTKLPLADIKGKPYLQVAHRLVWFREEHPDWTINTEVVEWNQDQKWIVMRGTILDDAGRMIATALKSESAKGFPDYIEKAETGAIGRALAMCGYGTQFDPELDEGDRLADSPVQPATRSSEASDNQKRYIGTLIKQTGREAIPASELNKMTKQQASKMIEEMKAELEAPKEQIDIDKALEDVPFE